MNPGDLKSIPVFADLTKNELQRVAECADEIEFAAGAQLLEEGRYAFEFFAIRDGEAEVMRDGAHVALLGPGDVMGEIGALSHGQRNASVIAKAPTTVIFIRAQDFRHLADDLPVLGERIRDLVKQRSA